MSISSSSVSPMGLLLLFLQLVIPAFGLYKLPEESMEGLVPNPKPGVFYLFQFPRTKTTPSQAALNLKTECWLHLSGSKFHRLSNHFFLGSHNHGTAPFAFFKESAKDADGVYINDSDTIVHRFRGFVKEQLRKPIDYQLFTILMLDRATRDAQGEGGLDWMLQDEGIAEQMVPLLVDDKPANYEQLKQTRTVKLEHKREFHIWLNSESWAAYFDAFNCEQEKKPAPEAVDCKERKIKFMSDYLKADGRGDQQQFHIENWEIVNTVIRKVIQNVLKRVFKANVGGESSSEAKLDQLLAARKIGENTLQMTPEAMFSTLEVTDASAESGSNTNEDDPSGPKPSQSEPSGSKEIVSDPSGSTQSGSDKPTFSNPQLLELLKSWLEPIAMKLNKKDYSALGVGTRQFFGKGKKPSELDCSLFGLLIQFFETPLNTTELREYFHGQLKNGLVERLEQYVSDMKGALGLDGGGWKQLTQRPWTLNYERPKIEKKFDGPFAVKTNDLKSIFDWNGKINSEELAKLPEVKAAYDAVEAKLVPKQMVPEITSEVDDEAAAKRLRIVAAYLCGLGEKSKIQKQCEKEHSKHVPKLHPDFVDKVRELAYHAVVDYNETLVKKNVLAAWNEARAVTENPLPVSMALVGNEW